MRGEWNYLKKDLQKTKKEMKEDWKTLKKDLRPIKKGIKNAYNRWFG